ncbi:unnamed protein product [Parnassius mnemosyne]|uniref:DUF5641 domain-containing protein n=1 Tax=Parnassius mnemosyne TaxID=213953 RepID=A0AAV1LYW4_9NEOP
MTSLPSPNYVDVPTHRLDRYKRLEQIRQHFWNRWSTEYMAELQQRTKWKSVCEQLQQGDLVIIKEQHTPPLCWRLGRVDKLYLGSDGIARVADVKTANGVVRRALNRLCKLPDSEA